MHRTAVIPLALLLLATPAIAQESVGALHNEILAYIDAVAPPLPSPVTGADAELRLGIVEDYLVRSRRLTPGRAAAITDAIWETTLESGAFTGDERTGLTLLPFDELMANQLEDLEEDGYISRRLSRVLNSIVQRALYNETLERQQRFLEHVLPRMGWKGSDAVLVDLIVEIGLHSSAYHQDGQNPPPRPAAPAGSVVKDILGGLYAVKVIATQGVPPSEWIDTIAAGAAWFSSL